VNALSGKQIEIAFEEQRAIVVEIGGGLRSYSVGDRELIDGYGADAMATAGRGQVLIPWPNRIEDGSYEFDGMSHQLPLTEPARRNAIHGLVRWASWAVAERETHRVVMTHVLHPQPGYPFTLALGSEYLLSGDGLRVRTTATNIGSEPCPFGAGSHPYLTVGTATVDSAVLHVPARTVLQSDDRGLPTAGAAAVTGTDHDFLQPRPIGATKLDDCVTDLERGEDGSARVGLANPEDGTGLTLWVDATYGYLMLFTGDLPEVDRRGLAVEPMTCPPNAFRSGEGLIRLEPGESFTGEWGIDPSAAPTS
jgi:aldose 1-epimerase